MAAAGAAGGPLAEERSNPAFSVKELTAVLHGGVERAERLRWIAERVAEDPVFRKDSVDLDRPSAMKRSWEKVLHTQRRIRELQLTDEDVHALRLFIDDINFSDLHLHMFIPALEAAATEQQQRMWLPKAKSYQWVGCYAQTEMGHGSNVQGIETTAEFDEQREEFEINTPTLTATKWWPGGLGKASTHAVLYARLILKGKDYGVQAFLVPLRCLRTHLPLPGIEVGDIGSKFGNGGYNTMDNGYLRLKGVRIPRTNMLMRYAEVTRDGNFRKPPNVVRQLSYGTMVWVRRGIVVEAGIHLSRAVTIAVRYSAVRRQFGEEGKPERKVLDYFTQQRRLLVLLSSAFAFRFVAAWLRQLYDDVMGRIKSGDFSTLPEVHASTAGLKAYTTTVTADGIEECRKLCGGHGYLTASGLPQLFAAYVPACTYEGDNTVMLLQTARYLIKALSLAASSSSSPPTGTASYLADIQHLRAAQCAADDAADFLSPSLQLLSLTVRSFHLVASAALSLSSAASQEQGFIDNGHQLTRAAAAHCKLVSFAKFNEAVLNPTVACSSTGGVLPALRHVCNVYALSLMEEAAGDLLEHGFLKPHHPPLIREALSSELRIVRKMAVPLVDSFNFTDHYLGSALGRYDGDVYTTLYEGAISSPINASDVMDGYHQYLKPLMEGSCLPSRL